MTKATIENANERALIRRHERRGTEDSLREVTEARPESPPPELPKNESHYGPARDNSQYLDPYEFVKPEISGLDETDDLPPVFRFSPPSEPSYITTSGPPDLTARDLTSEEIRRTFSVDGSWDHEIQELPPQLACHGIGKFRISVSAGPDEYYERLKKHLGDLTPDFVDYLEGTAIAQTDPVAWERFQNEFGSRSGRNDSINTRTSRSGSVVGKQTQYRDPVTGTLVVKGFAPFASSGVTNLLKETSSFFRKDSGLSLGGDSSISTLRTDGKKPNPFINRFSNQSTASTLATIDEAGAPMQISSRKFSRPCIFTDDRDIDSAIASYDDEGSWVDLVEQNPHRRRTSALSKMFEDAKKSKSVSKAAEARPNLSRARTPANNVVVPRPTSRTALDRSKAFRGMRPQFRRSHSRKMSTITNQHSGKQNQAELLAQPCSETTSDTDDSSDELEGPQELTPASDETLASRDASCDFDLWMANLPARTKAPINYRAEQQDAILGSSAKTMVPKKTRARSATAIRLPQVSGKAADVDQKTSN